MDDPNRSFPNSPYEMDPRDPRDPRIARSPFDSGRTSMGLDPTDYFGAAVGLSSYGGRRHSGGLYTPSAFDAEMMMGPSYQNVDDLVRRTNLLAQFVNSQISYAARYGQLQPKMCGNGKFPEDFRVPKTVEEVRVMHPSTLDCILRAYGLPTDLRSLHLTSRDNIGPKAAHQAKLCTLFDFLGATQISERQRMRRAAVQTQAHAQVTY
ncbi:hypothetical protein GQ43DRAFT_468609 [Delitschia confertaspora ATCC 74209]|uniref:Uncharacterized protein n=1 Tax=Delitschia confertaspora ATCC 74209 TaxID=1513339 RepID=A0A9P4JSP2_9PLEO|nr:hypothetical protein GQ43DRAFT_468609 [Delitschia confertaspora ATCC 74209]